MSSSPVVGRGEWGARPPKSISHNIDPSRGGIAWHYEGPKMGTFPHSSCATKVRAIQAYHQDQKGWADIAYTSCICPHGYIYVGRWLGVRSAAQGTTDGNLRFYAVCYLSGVGDRFTDEAKVAALDVREILRNQGHAGFEDKPHSFFHATGCPGDPIRDWILAGLPSPPTSGVLPMFDPPYLLQPIVAELTPLDGRGIWLLGQDGSIYAFGGSAHYGGANGQSYWGQRKAARLDPHGAGYSIVATTGEKYDYG